MLNLILSVVLAVIIHELGHYLADMFLGHTLEFRRQGIRFIWDMPNDTAQHQRLMTLSGFDLEVLFIPILFFAGLTLYPYVVILHLIAYPFYAGEANDFKWI